MKTQVTDTSGVMWTVREKFMHYGIEMYYLENDTHYALKPVKELQ